MTGNSIPFFSCFSPINEWIIKDESARDESELSLKDIVRLVTVHFVITQCWLRVHIRIFEEWSIRTVQQNPTRIELYYSKSVLSRGVLWTKESFLIPVIVFAKLVDDEDLWHILKYTGWKSKHFSTKCAVKQWNRKQIFDRDQNTFFHCRKILK
jgi:hypothetical protein